MEQVPLPRVLDFTSSDGGRYTFRFPKSACYGIVVSGGASMGAIHRAARDFVTKDARSSFHTDVLNIALQFYRPVFAGQETVVELETSNVSRVATTLQVKVSQKKTCTVGYIALSNLSFPGNIDTSAGWELSPAPLPVTMAGLERDDDPNWIGYHCPFAVAGSHKAPSYIKYFVPREEESAYKTDQWLAPGWKGADGPAVWTDELVHWVVDNGLPLFLTEEKKREHHEQGVRVGLAQRQARRDGRSDQFKGDDLNVPWTTASLAVSTEFRKLLPPEGVPRLFMRGTTTGIVQNRMDYHLTVLDEHGDVVATSHHTVLVIPLQAKEAKL